MVNNFKIHSENFSKANKNNLRNKYDEVQYINFGEDDQMEIQGFVFSKLKGNLCLILSILTLGILRLLFHWYPVWHLKATHKSCSLREAEKALIIDDYNGKTRTYFVKIIKTLNSASITENIESSRKLLKYRLEDGQTKEKYEIRIVKCKKLTYIWDEDKKKFLKLAGLENGITKVSLHEFKGQSNEEQTRKRIVYGNNQILTPEQTVLQLLVLEALTPFYMFQVFSLVVWMAEQYYYYAVAIVIMSVAGITTSIIQTRRNQENLKGTVNFTATVTVSRGNGKYEELSTKNLVPGDLIVVPEQGCEMHCDAVLLQGSCVVNESMLTGESVPVTKAPLDRHESLYNLKEDVNSTLFCGTKVIQTRTRENEKVLAVVIRTSFLTTKGELVRSILYPPPADFKFDRDSYKYIGILTLIAALGVIYTVVSKWQRQISPLDIAIKALDIITIVIPPALPAAMTVGKLFAINRLKSSRIYCINSRVINVSGSVNCVCFDKTGTLTEDALDMWGVVPIENQEIKKPFKNILQLPSNSNLFRGMATCHSLTAIDGIYGGDPLDVKMFESTEWLYEDNHYAAKSYGDFTPLAIVRSENVPKLEIGIVKQFQFSSTLQRMSVIVKSPERTYFELFCKGSPEKIISLSNQNSIPIDIFSKLKEYTEQGYRVIGLAKSILPENLSYQEISKLHRDDVEKNLEFLGLLILENPLKPETVGVIKILKEACLKVVMITGDNIQTAVTVAKDCHIIDGRHKVIEIIAEKRSKVENPSMNYHLISKPGEEAQVNRKNGNFKNLDLESPPINNLNYCFVITGQSWANVVKYFPEIIPKIMAKGAVFARMSGTQKQQLVESLKSLGYYVAMCGDGANDCGALKAAHVGISLSEAESSVASPFTSKEPNISCTPEIIKEGRAALVTAFGVFQMMLCYSLTEFTSVIILYGIDTNLSSLQFLYIDICLILNFAATFGRTKAYPKLAKIPPRTSLLSFIPIASMGLFLILAAISQLIAYKFIQFYDWFYPFVYPDGAGINTFDPSFENYAVYCSSMFQYVTMAVIFSKGKPYRKSILTNVIFGISLLIMTILNGYMTLYPAKWVTDAMELEIPPEMNGRLMCIYVAIANFIFCYFMQSFIVEVILEKWIEPVFSKCSKNKKEYVKVIKAMKNDLYWPPVNGDTTRLSKLNENGRNGIENSAYIDTEKML